MNYQIDLMNLRCLDENDFGPWASDEPYVVVSTICFRNAFEGVDLPPGIDFPDINLPSVLTTKFGPWSGVDTGEIAITFEIPPDVPKAVADIFRLRFVIRDPIWGVNGIPMPIGNPDELFILVGLMEHDHSNPNKVRTTVQSALSAAAQGYANAGLSRNRLVKKMRQDMVGAIDLGRLAIFNDDDPIGGVRELRITSSNLNASERLGSIVKDLFFVNSSTRYRARFRIKSS